MIRECYKEKNAWLAMGFVQMHMATGENMYLEKAEKIVAETDHELSFGMVYSYLFQVTGKAEYEKAIELGKEKVVEKADNMFCKMPFYMECETRYGKKEMYISIVDALIDAKNSITTVEEACRYLMALIDTMDAMDFQIYELYRKLQDNFKNTLKAIMLKEGMGKKDRLCIAYAMLKACRMNLLLREKYADIAFDCVNQMSKDNAKSSLLEEEPYFAMAYAQSLMLKKDME